MLRTLPLKQMNTLHDAYVTCHANYDKVHSSGLQPERATRMPFIAKLLMTVAIVIFGVQVGRRFPSRGELIATIPLTSLVVSVRLLRCFFLSGFT